MKREYHIPLHPHCLTGFKPESISSWRNIRFYDTAKQGYRAKHLIIRQRTNDLILKFRHPDQHVAKDFDSKLPLVKFEEDIRVPFICQYSKTFRLSALPHGVKSLLPFPIVETVYKAGKLPFGPEVELTKWVFVDKVIYRELSFKCVSKDAKKAYDAFLKMQRHSSYNAEALPTKTETIYKLAESL